MVRLAALVTFLVLRSAVGCTCVTASPFDPVREGLKSATAVIRATVISSSPLPARQDMRGRQRYRVTMRVAEYWKGPVDATVALYDLAPGMDCMGSDLAVGKEYLLFVFRESAEGVRLEPDLVWYSFSDVVPADSFVLRPQLGCMPGGEVSNTEVRKQLRSLGKGKTPRT